MSYSVEELRTLAKFVSGWTAGLDRSEVMLKAAGRVEQLERENAELRTIFRVNMLRAFPGMSHEEISLEIDSAISSTTAAASQPQGEGKPSAQGGEQG